MFYKKGVLKNFAKLTGKHLCQSLFFNKVAVLGLQLYQKETLAQVFSCKFCEISKNTFFYKILPMAASINYDLYFWTCQTENFHLCGCGNDLF